MRQASRLVRLGSSAHFRNFNPTRHLSTAPGLLQRHFAQRFSVLSSAAANPSVFSLNQLQQPRQLCTNPQNDKVAPASGIQKATGRDLVLSPPALVITREYEWANIIVGFEQANKYSIRAAPGGEVVGYLAEESSIGSTITRNVMRTRRPFKATVFDKDGNIIFTLRRPLFLVSTSIFVETPEGESLGEVHMNWHMWRRRYDLYVDKAQFASVDSGFLAVDFDMRDVNGKKMASVNKDFTGFARELFTDARQYVLRLDPSYGLSSDGVLVRDNLTVDVPVEDYSDVKLGPRERAIILATAVAIDFDYFSVHSRGHMNPMMMMPIPVGGGGESAGGAGAGAGGAGAAVGADILSDAAEGDDAGNGDEYYVPDDSAAGASGPGNGFESGMSQANTEADSDPYGAPLGGEDDNASDMEWATFEEPDHGFADEPDDSDNDDDSWFGGGDDSDGGDSDGGGGLFGVISDIFTGGDS